MRVNLSSHIIRMVFLISCLLFFCHPVLFSQHIVKGKVSDKSGAALAGASVMIKNTKTATATDSVGNFSIEAAPGNTIEFSSVGYSNYQVVLGNETELNISLADRATNLDSIVVIGYGTIRKKDLTGSVGSVSSKDFNKGIFNSADQLIQGKISGVQIISNNGLPGGAATIKIRGNSALSGTGLPLFVIDGVPLDGKSLQSSDNPLNFINVNDIASIDVLKDASATAIYGSRAAYGVIIINTKKPVGGPARIDVAASTGFSTAVKKIRVLNAGEYRDAIKYYGVPDVIDKGGNTDAQDAVLQTAWQQNYSIAGSGGNDNAKYRFSAGFLNQDGIVINTGFKKYSADITANLKALNSKKLGIDFYLNSSQYIQSAPHLSSGDSEVIQDALSWNPTDSLRNADGSVKVISNDGLNPLALSAYTKDNLKVTTLFGTITPYYKFTDWLDYKLLVSINYSSGISRSSIDQVLNVYAFFPPLGLASIANNELITQQITHTLNFNKEIYKELNLNAVAGFEYTKFTSKGFSLSGNGPQNGFGNYGLDYTNYVQYSNADNRSIASYIDPAYKLQSFFGRTIFTYKNKYLLTATFRADGSTKFGANNKYGYFPSFAAAWNIDKENFFKVDWVNSFKIRVGWGKTGNQEFPAGSAQALYAFQNNGSVIQINNPNPNLKWQSDGQYNIGADFSIFNNRISGTVDYFNKTTTNLLFPSPPILPAPPGIAYRWINLDGKIINKGLEVLLNGAIIKNQKTNWNLSVNATFLKNNVSGLPAPVLTGFLAGPVEIIQNGLPIDAFYTRKFLGLDKSTGYSIYQDSGATSYYAGDPNPKILLGITSTFSYKKFSLTANMSGSFGQDIYNETLQDILNVNGINGGNIALSIYKNPVKESFGNPVTPSSRWIQKGSYLKMTSLSVLYNLGYIANTFKEMSISVTAQNLFIITKYRGFDPEVNVDRNYNGIPSLGFDFSRYPTSRSVILSINFSL